MRQPTGSTQKSGPGLIRQDTTRTAKHIITNIEVGDSAMSHSTRTTARTSSLAAPTQRLRDLIDASTWGGASPDELHGALLQLEAELGLPLTEATTEEVAA
jgi:hypothetical protein